MYAITKPWELAISKWESDLEGVPMSPNIESLSGFMAMHYAIHTNMDLPRLDDFMGFVDI